MLYAHRQAVLQFREKQLEVERTPRRRESRRNMRSSNTELEQRVRVLEQIVTDSGAQTAAQIEALRDAGQRDRRARSQPATTRLDRDR